MCKQPLTYQQQLVTGFIKQLDILFKDAEAHEDFLEMYSFETVKRDLEGGGSVFLYSVAEVCPSQHIDKIFKVFGDVALEVESQKKQIVTKPAEFTSKPQVA